MIGFQRPSSGETNRGEPVKTTSDTLRAKAERGDAEAQAELANDHHDRREFVKAVEWDRKAAEDKRKAEEDRANG